MGDGYLSLCWNNHHSTFCHVISNLRQKERYSDVTIACEGRFYPVHKLVLSVCSEYFDAMLERTPCKHPIIVLRDVQPEDLEALLSYMYEGIVSVAQNDLARLIKTAEMLGIKGLAVADESSFVTTDGRRVTSDTTIAFPIIGQTVFHHARPNRENRSSPQAKRRKREENGNVSVIGQTFTAHDGSPSADDVASPNSQDHFEGRQRQRVEIHRDHISKDVPQAEVVVAETIVKQEPTIEDAEGMAKGTATLIGSYGVVVSDGGTHHAVVSHSQDPNTQVITHRYEPAHLQGTHQAHSQPLAEAVAEALAVPSGMQTWLGGNELGTASFTTVEAYTTDPEVQTQALQAQTLDGSQTTTVNVTNSSSIVNAVSAGCTAVVVETAPVAPPTTTTGNTTTSSGGREGNQLKCHYCNRATFRQTSDLKRHIRIHTGEKPFKCSFCPYKASRKDLLQAHSSKMHGASQLDGGVGKFNKHNNESR